MGFFNNNSFFSQLVIYLRRKKKYPKVYCHANVKDRKLFLSFWRETEWWIIISPLFIAQVKQNVSVGTNWIYSKLELKTNV